MIIVIDAYNLLRTVPPYKKTISDKERAQFIKQLGIYGRRKGHKIVIVFDGGPHEWSLRENMKTVQVVYSGIHASADDYIKEYLSAHSAKDLLLVTSDSELNHFADRLHISSIDSFSFNQLVHEELYVKKVIVHEKGDVAVKLTHDNDDDIDALMLNASKVVPIKSEDVVSTDKGRNVKKNLVSKQERALLKKLNKL